MDLKSRKQIQNLPGYVIGKDGVDDHRVDTGNLGVLAKPGNILNHLGPVTVDNTGVVAMRSWKPGENEDIKSDFAGGSKANSIISGVAGIYGSISNQLNSAKSQSELLADAGRSNYSVMGIGYQEQNRINKDAELRALDKSGLGNTVGSTLSGVQAGMAFGPIGGVIGGAVGLVGGLFGWGASKNKLRKRIANAQSFADRSNVVERSGAVSTALQQDYYSENGNTTGGVLYANRGKDLKKPIYENK